MRVVYVLAEYGLHNQIVVEHLRARPMDRVSVVKVPLVLRGKGRGATAARIVPKLSRRFLAGKLVEAGILLAVTATPKLLGRGAVFQRLRPIARRRRLPFHRSPDIMSEETLAFIGDQQPDVVITLFHQIVRTRLIALPRCLAALEDGRLSPAAQDPAAGAYCKWPDSAAFDRLRDRGHALVSWRQLCGLLVGRHDALETEEVLEVRSPTAGAPM